MACNYTLYWGVYPQWTKLFNSEDDAIKEAKKYAKPLRDVDGSWKLIKLQPVPFKVDE